MFVKNFQSAIDLKLKTNEMISFQRSIRCITMFRLQVKDFSTASVVCATVKKRPQGFAKAKVGSKASPKKISSGTLYKDWKSTISTSGFNKNATILNLPIFESKNITNDQIFSFSDEQYKFLYRLGSFKQNQFNELFNRPISFVRKETTKKFFDLLKSSENKKFILTGEGGVGKSTLLSQIHAYAHDTKSLVINFSHPELFLNGRNDFFFNETQYVQPMYLKKLLSKILKANDPNLLSSILLLKDYKFTTNTKSTVTKIITLKSGENSILDLLSIKTLPHNRGELFQALIDELSSQSKVPVYFTVDNFSRILTGPFTSYKNTQNKNIHILDFQIGKVIMDVVSGDVEFKNKDSCVVLATSGIDRTNRTLPIGLGKIPHDPYITRYHYEPILAEKMLQGKITQFEVPKLNKDEIRKLIQLYLNSNILTNKDSKEKSLDQLVEEKYFLSGNGNPRELLKSIVLYPF